MPEPTSTNGHATDDLIVSPDCLRGDGSPIARTPPGQRLTSKWPVLHYGHVPTVQREDWSLRIWGWVENEVTLDWAQFNALPKVKVRCDIHCVTHWSRLDNLFEGVATRIVAVSSIGVIECPSCGKKNAARQSPHRESSKSCSGCGHEIVVPRQGDDETVIAICPRCDKKQTAHRHLSERTEKKCTQCQQTFLIPPKRRRPIDSAD